MQRFTSALRQLFILVVLVLLAWPIDSTYSESTTLIKVDGSSTVFPITKRSQKSFKKKLEVVCG